MTMQPSQESVVSCCFNMREREREREGVRESKVLMGVMLSQIWCILSCPWSSKCHCFHLGFSSLWFPTCEATLQPDSVATAVGSKCCPASDLAAVRPFLSQHWYIRNCLNMAGIVDIYLLFWRLIASVFRWSTHLVKFTIRVLHWHEGVMMPKLTEKFEHVLHIASRPYPTKDLASRMVLLKLLDWNGLFSWTCWFLIASGTYWWRFPTLHNCEVVYYSMTLWLYDSMTLWLYDSMTLSTSVQSFERRTTGTMIVHTVQLYTAYCPSRSKLTEAALLGPRCKGLAHSAGTQPATLALCCRGAGSLAKLLPVVLQMLAGDGG